MCQGPTGGVVRISWGGTRCYHEYKDLSGLTCSLPSQCRQSINRPCGLNSAKTKCSAIKVRPSSRECATSVASWNTPSTLIDAKNTYYTGNFYWQTPLCCLASVLTTRQTLDSWSSGYIILSHTLYYVKTIELKRRVWGGMICLKVL